ncbi:MAG: hypothetical protein NC099_02305, partial [Corallococcus sp.]|nr:hypothetical protein [Corallococcus sp.]
MNGYDFDETILKGNSVRSFFCYCMLRLPYLVLYMPVLLLAVILNGLHMVKSDAYYNMLTKYVVFVPNREKFVKKFWDKNIKKIKSWYLKQQREDDIIISASPAYLVEEACARLHVKCIATPYDLKKAKVIGGKD